MRVIGVVVCLLVGCHQFRPSPHEQTMPSWRERASVPPRSPLNSGLALETCLTNEWEALQCPPSACWLWQGSLGGLQLRGGKHVLRSPCCGTAHAACRVPGGWDSVWRVRGQVPEEASLETDPSDPPTCSGYIGQGELSGQALLTFLNHKIVSKKNKVWHTEITKKVSSRKNIIQGNVDGR